MAAGFFFRMLAVFFSKGYGMSDDHFLIIEAAQYWVDYGFRHWLPTVGATTPDGHSLFYSGIHYYIFLCLKWLGINNPQGKMYIIRLLHAVWSMFTIYFGYKIAKSAAGQKTANRVGLILALLFFFPMFSVRNLVEMVCIPPLVIGTWFMTEPARKDRLSSFAWAGLLFGIAFNIRFQSLFFVGGAGLVLIFERHWKKLFMFSLTCFITIFLVQGVADMVIWKRPFAEFFEYVNYNLQNKYAYSTGVWYKYILLIGGILIPPVSLFLIFGYLRSWRRYSMLFLPAFVFLVFHSMFPNKQERFILPVIPFIIILGCIGWKEYLVTSGFWMNKTRLLNRCWGFFWTVNCLLLPLVSTTYSKKSRVEAMVYLSHRTDLKSLLVEERTEDNAEMCPIYYLGRWDVNIIYLTKKDSSIRSLYRQLQNYPDTKYPDYIIFVGSENINTRVSQFRAVYPGLQYLTTIYPSLLDNIMEWLNPVNKNRIAYIYRFDRPE